MTIRLQHLTLTVALLLFAIAPPLAAEAADTDNNLENVEQLGPQYYRWTDESGRIQFSDKPPVGTIKNVQQEALKAAPNIGNSDSNAIYQRLNSMLDDSAEPAEDTRAE